MPLLKCQRANVPAERQCKQRRNASSPRSVSLAPARTFQLPTGPQLRSGLRVFTRKLYALGLEPALRRKRGAEQMSRRVARVGQMSFCSCSQQADKPHPAVCPRVTISHTATSSSIEMDQSQWLHNRCKQQPSCASSSLHSCFSRSLHSYTVLLCSAGRKRVGNVLERLPQSWDLGISLGYLGSCGELEGTCTALSGEGDRAWRAAFFLRFLVFPLRWH